MQYKSVLVIIGVAALAYVYAAATAGPFDRLTDKLKASSEVKELKDKMAQIAADPKVNAFIDKLEDIAHKAKENSPDIACVQCLNA